MKKVLIITYHWPPSGGIAVLRCLKFAKYLREFGWEPVIYTAKNPAYQYFDYTNDKDIPEGLEIHKTPISEPVSIFKKLSGRKKSDSIQDVVNNSRKKRSVIDTFSIWVRGNFFIPDARYRWIKPSVKYLSNYLEEHKIDAILTDGPTHTNTVIGLRLAQKFGIPWLADFQDPWTQVDYYTEMYIGRRADKKHKALEQEVFQTASKTTIASPTWKRDLESIGAKNVDVIYYGYDEADFSNYTPKATDTFEIFHGGLLGKDRNPEPFLQALKKIKEEFPEEMKKVKLRLAGHVDLSVVETIERFNLTEMTEYLGMIPRADVIKLLETASMLLLPINKAANAGGRIPGKLFEMLRSEKPILVLGPSNGDVKSIVESKRKGRSFQYDEFNEVYNFLKKAIVDGITDNFDKEESLTEFSNFEITRKIGKYLDEITSN